MPRSEDSPLPERLTRIPLAKPYFAPEMVEEVRRVLESGWVSQGPKVEEFEKEVADYCGARFGVAVNSCTSGLHLSLIAAGVGPGDEVVVPDFTFPATGNSVLSTGAKPVVADIDDETFAIDPDSIEKRLSGKTKCIMVVHPFGHSADLDRIAEIAEGNDLTVIEDAAPALGSEYKGKKIGGSGNMVVFSFHARKIVSTGEGGMILTSDEDMAQRLRALRSHGMMKDAWARAHSGFTLPGFEMLGYNYRLSDILAAVGLVQVRRIEALVEKRRRLADHYAKVLDDLSATVRPPVEKPWSKHVFQSYVVTLLRDGVRDRVILGMRERGVETTIGTYSLTKLPLFQEATPCPKGNRAFENSLTLPMYYDLTERDIDTVVRGLSGVLSDIGQTMR